MRVITWNIHGANENSPVWDYILDKSPDIVLLQEVGAMPEKIGTVYNVISRRAIYKNGKSQRFSTSVLFRGTIIGELPLSSEYEWVNRELEFFKGNLIGCKIELTSGVQVNVVSVYSPAWPINKERYEGIDISHVKLKSNPDLWVTEIIWLALKNAYPKEELWVVGGDYNSSETFDKEWQIKNGIKFGIKSAGNREIINRMSEIGFTECLRAFNNGKIIPTFKHSRGEIAHQIDHMYVTEGLYSKLAECRAEDQSLIFDQHLSDHLPIIADIDFE